ncbi:MAG: AI-2E family transporter [Acidobacteria bacterium]|nr:MAG: AI-2E family transporter [Acidobacteriota bacterium]
MNNHKDAANASNGGPPRSLMITGLFILALLYTLYLARDLFLPIVLAVLLHFLLRPAVRILKKARMPEQVGAGLIIVVLLSAFGFAFYKLSGPASQWLAQAPPILRKIENEIRQWRGPVQQVKKAADQVERIAGMEEGSKVREVQIREPGLSETLFAGTRAFVATVVVMILLLYFLLASGDLFLEKTLRVLPTLTDKKRAVGIAYNMEEHISRYLLSVTAINIGLGIAETFAMFLLGMPNPVLWGTMAAIFNFVPYLGALAGCVTVGMVGYVQTGQLEWGLLVGAVYFGVTAIEGGFVTPMLLAHRLTLNPVVLLVGVIFWGWLWGIAGTLLAVPLMSSIKIFCDHIEPLMPIGEFLGQ